MAVTNPFAIQFGGMTFGGDSSTYQLIGPYVIDRGYESLRLVFDVLVVGTSIEELQELVYQNHAVAEQLTGRFHIETEPDPKLVLQLRRHARWSQSQAELLGQSVHRKGLGALAILPLEHDAYRHGLEWSLDRKPRYT